MGVLILHAKTLYCDVLEHQFVTTKTEEKSNITVPWKTSSPNNASEKNSAKSSAEQRIPAIHETSVQVAFCVHGAIVHKSHTKQTAHFYAGGQRSSRTQFPLQNAFALTVHKTQSLTLPKITVDLDNLFSPGQAYVAISRSKTWENLEITNLCKDCFITDPKVTQEYQRLEAIAAKPLSIT
jgi:hypothetical protein